MSHLRFAIAALFLLGITESSAQDCSKIPVGNYVKMSLKALCQGTGSTFVLIDGSDPISAQSKQWLGNNIFKDKSLTHFSDGGEMFSAAYMADQPVADLDTRSVCFPKPMEKVNPLFEAPSKFRAFHAAYDCAISDTQAKILDERTETGKSLIIEAVREIFSNPKYQQSNTQGQRTFVLASDLYQNSSIVSFFELCTYRADGSKVCPDFKKLTKSDTRISRYLKASLPKMRSTDKVRILNINVNGKVDQSARDFWTQYFEAAGVLPENLEYTAELDHH
jgi:hypothetical protein